MTTTLPTSSPDFIGSWPRLTGRQEPEFESRQPGDESEGDRCAKFGRNIGLRCMPWEWRTLRGITSLQPANEHGERLWTHRDVAIECTRQQGKTLLIVLLILFHMFVRPVVGRARTRKIIYTAQQWSTVSDVFDRVEAVIMRVPSLRKRLAKPPSKRDNHGVIELTNGAKAEFGPRSMHFGRGYTEVDLLINDEAYDVDPAHDSNLTGSQSAAANPQTIYISTSPVFAEHPKCQILSDLHRQGKRRAADLFYCLFAAPRNMDAGEPETFAAAQPSYGVATNEREIRSKHEKARSSPRRRAIFEADYLGWGSYAPPEVDQATEISADKWAAMGPTRPDYVPPKLIHSPAIGLHREGGIWTIVGAQYTDAGRAHLEIGYSKAATATDVVATVVELVAAWNPVAVAIKNRSDAAALKAELLKAGIEPEMIDGGVWAQWCGGFLNAAVSDKLSHSGQDALNDGAAAAVKHELPAGGFIWDESAAGMAAGALCSATLAHGALLAFGNERKRKTTAPRSGVNRTENSRESTDFDVMSAAF